MVITNFVSKAVKEGVTKLVLDTSYLAISKVSSDGSPLSVRFSSDRIYWQTTEISLLIQFNTHPRHEAYGSALEITLNQALQKDQTAKIKIGYATTDKCSAVQWLTPR